MKNRDVESLPGGITFKDTSGSGDKIESMFDVRLDLAHLLLDIQDVRQRIRASFYADMFLMLQNDVDARKTATEVAELHEEKMLMLGPVLERLHNELLNPLIDTYPESQLDLVVAGTADAVMMVESEALQLPDERNGLLFVFRVFERVSYALILNTQDPVKPGDRFSQP